MYRNALIHSLDSFIFQDKGNHFTEPHYKKEGWNMQLYNKFSPRTSWMKSQDSRGIRTFWLSSIRDFFALSWGCWMPISAGLGIARETPTLGPVQAQCCCAAVPDLGLASALARLSTRATQDVERHYWGLWSSGGDGPNYPSVKSCTNFSALKNFRLWLQFASPRVCLCHTLSLVIA